METARDYIKSGLLGLIRGDEEVAKQDFIRAIELKSEKIVDEITINNDFSDDVSENS